MNGDKNSFAHFSDAHLGHRQYGSKKRRDDMFMTYNTTIREVLDKDVDFVVFSGDLFHKKSVNARALSDVEIGLNKLKRENVPFVAIQGNHQISHYKLDLSWLEYLHKKEKLVFLEADFDGSGPIFEKHDFEDPRTSSGFVDFGNIRVFGLQYLGRQTSNYFPKVAEGIKQANNEFDEPDFTILLGHFGIEGHIPGMGGGISFEELEPLEELVDYLGLGHLHKEYSHGEWVFNPGSLEAHDTRQAQWNHGYYVVDVENNGKEVEFNKSKRRPFFRIDFSVGEYETPEELKEGFEQGMKEKVEDLRQIQKKNHYKRNGDVRFPVIDLRLEGLLQFSRTQLDADAIHTIAESIMDAVYVNLTDATESKEISGIVKDLEESGESVKNKDGQIDREKLEGAVFRKIVGKDSRYNDETEDVADVLNMVKKEVLSAEDSEKVAETIKKSRRELFPSEGG